MYMGTAFFRDFEQQTGNKSDKLISDYEIRNLITDKIRTHAVYDNKELVLNLLMKKFPTEPESIYNYRMKNFKASTRKFYIKVYQILSRIQTAEEYKITGWPSENIKNGIEELLKPLSDGVNSVKSYPFTELLNLTLIDPNAYVVVMPNTLGWPDAQSEDFDPNALTALEEMPIYIHEYKSKDVYIDRFDEIWVKHGEFIDSNNRDIEVIFRITDTAWERYYYTKGVGLELINLYPNISGRFPGIKTGGVHIEGRPESFLIGMIADLDQALIIDNDISHTIKMHIFPEKWRMVSEKCKTCNGQGLISAPSAGGFTKGTCKACNGTGKSGGTFGEVVVDIDQLVNLQQAGLDLKPPYIGYVEKSIDIPTFLQNEHSRLVQQALSAINMEFIGHFPSQQSGVAKEYDRAELRAFLSVVSNHQCSKAEELYKIATQLRYPDTDKNRIEEISINKPNQFTFIIEKDINERVSILTSPATPQTLKVAEQLQLVSERFRDDKKQFNYETNVVKLDPLAGYSDADKQNLLQLNLISVEDFGISMNIRSLLSIIETRFPKFYEKKFFERRNILKDFYINEFSGPEPISENTESSNTNNIDTNA